MTIHKMVCQRAAMVRMILYYSLVANRVMHILNYSFSKTLDNFKFNSIKFPSKIYIFLNH